ncbi:MAG TPA: apolipoprotein N-acyltransferase [Chitinophagaceae bacterium]|nr:apolipoprotein N-acyltransferase [Chitinophagaceae bacterium]
MGGGLLLWAAWPMSPLNLLLFVAWIPLLWIEDRVKSGRKLFGLAYIHMVIWNVLVTWWVANASLPGAIGAFLCNSLVMCLPWLLMHIVKRKFGSWIGYGSLIVFWLTFEYIHHNWELSWPWLTLGNGFATHPEWVQWYEMTGTTGGSLWILLSNVLAYSLFVEFKKNGRSKAYYISFLSWILLLALPILGSRIMLSREKKLVEASIPGARNNVVVVQPNIDPYKEKFTGSIESQVQKLIVLSEKQIDPNTTLVIWPETAIPAQALEPEIKTNYFYNPVWSFLSRHPSISLLTGIDSYKTYGRDKKNASKTARHDPVSGIYYDFFNTAAFADADTNVNFYHKAKLVPGVETLPSFLKWMGKWFENFGGISGTLGRDNERKVFTDWHEHFKAAPIICYESIYSDYLTEYVRKGANILTIITNDGWWGNTPGYKQHVNYARLRAIENRRWVARSANTGISCFIDPLGNIILPQPWDTATSIKLAIPIETRLTFFSRHGDILSRAVSVVSILLLALLLISWVMKKFFHKKFPALRVKNE